jgi:hypothetical protein
LTSHRIHPTEGLERFVEKIVVIFPLHCLTRGKAVPPAQVPLTAALARYATSDSSSVQSGLDRPKVTA